MKPEVVTYLLTQVFVLVAVAVAAGAFVYFKMQKRFDRILKAKAYNDDRLEKMIREKRRLEAEVQIKLWNVEKVEKDKARLKHALGRLREVYAENLTTLRKEYEQDIRVELTLAAGEANKLKEEIDLLLDLVAEMQYNLEKKER